jgi:hypothetical protein
LVPATLPVVGAVVELAMFVEPGVLVPVALDPSAWLPVVPQGAASGAPDVVPDVVPEVVPLVCANAAPVPIAAVASATAPNRCAKVFLIADLHESAIFLGGE